MKRFFGVALAVILAMSLLAGCAASASKNSSAMTVAQSAPEAPAASADAYAEEPAEVETAMDTGGWDSVAAQEEGNFSGGYGGHKIIKTASMGLETRNFDQDLAYIKEKTNQMGGYVSSSYVNGKKPENYGDSGRYANLSLRIPQEKMDAFLADARGIATVTYENTGGEDITSSYFDTESRLAVYTSQRERILKLLDTAETMEDIIALETELSRLTYEIESLTTQLKRWDDLVDYATVNIDLSELAPASAAASDDSIGTRINEGLQNTLAGIAVFFENLAVFLVVASPVLLILAVIAVVIVLLVKRSRKKHAQLRQGSYYDKPQQEEKK